MTEQNPCWRPIAEPKSDPVERALRVIWSYEARPVRIMRSQRYSLVLTEPLPSPKEPSC